LHSYRESLNKRLYTFGLKSRDCARRWAGQYWRDVDGDHVIACGSCRRFTAELPRCAIPFGSPLRKCVSAAQEANLHSLDGKSLLEIGFGRHSIPRKLVRSAGGTWTGIEPTLPRSQSAEIGKGGFGHVADIPFPDATFDIVVGIQSLEHWADPLPDPALETGHAAGLAEVHRVLKPGGSIYFDAPIHLHGHEMFITGDIPRIRALFGADRWSGLTIERWREDFAPLERYPTPEVDLGGWAHSVASYPPEQLEEIRVSGSVWLITISATKRGA
jgi:SAM-dependent methyltransferase